MDTEEPVKLADIYAVVNLAGIDNKELIRHVIKAQRLLDVISELYGLDKAFVIFYPDRTVIPERSYQIAIMEPIKSALNIGYHAERLANYGRLYTGQQHQIATKVIQHRLGWEEMDDPFAIATPDDKKWWQYLL